MISIALVFTLCCIGTLRGSKQLEYIQLAETGSHFLLAESGQTFTPVTVG